MRRAPGAGVALKLFAVALRRTEPHLALILACSVLLAFGIWLRAVDLHRPGAFMFDEHHFVENARNYLQGRRDWNDHPPLGKLVIDFGILGAGDRSLGWRLPLLVAGIGNVAAAGVLAWRLSNSKLALLLAASLAAVDGFLIVYSRAALLDGLVTLFYLLSLIFATWASFSGIVLAAVCGGLMAGTKFSGIVCLVPIGFALSTIHDRQRWLRGVVAVLVFSAVYIAVFALGLYLARQPFDVGAVVGRSLGLVEHHAKLTGMTHWATSAWSTWFLPFKPITLWQTAEAGSIRIVSSLGNLALWWSANLAMFWLGAGVLRRGTTRSPWPVVFCLVAYVAPLLPWTLAYRDSYIYHYLPAYSVAIVTVSLLLLRGYAGRHRLSVLSGVVLIGLVAAFYAPVWAGLPLAESGVRARLFAPSWR